MNQPKWNKQYDLFQVLFCILVVMQSSLYVSEKDTLGSIYYRISLKGVGKYQVQV